MMEQIQKMQDEQLELKKLTKQIYKKVVVQALNQPTNDNSKQISKKNSMQETDKKP